MRIIGIIPARYGSTRFPGKPLAKIQGRPMIAHVVENARQARSLEAVVVATDDSRIAEAAAAAGAEVAMTPPELPSGTDRVAWVAAGRSADVVVNVQGDEPLLPGSAIDALVAPFASDPALPMATLAAPFHDLAEVENPRTAKIVLTASGRALYFSRAPIPFAYRPASPERRLGAPSDYVRHIGIYAYRGAFLAKLAATPPTPLELLEGLEQLRALHMGAVIQVVCLPHGTIGVDTPEDLARVEQILSRIDMAAPAAPRG